MGIRQSNNPEGNMPYSQMFNQYQNTSPYDNQPWNEVDFTTSLPPNDNFKSIDDTGFYDFSGLPNDNQNAPSPNYSQFLNFDSSEVGSYSVPSEDISPNRFNGPQAPISFIGWVDGSYIERGVLEETLQGSCCVLGLRKRGNAPGIWAVVSSTWDRHEHWDLGDGTPAF